MDMVQLIQQVEGDSSQVLLLKVADMCPRGKSCQEGPTINSEADTMQDGYMGSSGLQRVGGSKSMCPRGEEGGVMVVGRAGSVMSGDGERFCLGENEGQEEGSYRSNESTGEKTWGWG